MFSTSLLYTGETERRRKLLIFPELHIFSLGRDQHFSDAKLYKVAGEANDSGKSIKRRKWKFAAFALV
jgi:hypothetical protein